MSILDPTYIPTAVSSKSVVIGFRIFKTKCHHKLPFVYIVVQIERNVRTNKERTKPQENSLRLLLPTSRAIYQPGIAENVPASAFPARLRSEIGLIYGPPPKNGSQGGNGGGLRSGVDILTGGGEPRYINLGGLPQRARGSGCVSTMASVR